MRMVSSLCCFLMKFCGESELNADCMDWAEPLDGVRVCYCAGQK